MQMRSDQAGRFLLCRCEKGLLILEGFQQAGLGGLAVFKGLGYSFLVKNSNSPSRD